MIRPRFFIGRRDTRWDVYPQQEPTVGVALDYYGFWAWSPEVGWFKSPASYVTFEEVTEADAIAATRESAS